MLLACQTPSVVPADTAAAAVRAALVMEIIPGPLLARAGPATVGEGYSVRAVAFDLQPGFSIAGGLWEPDSPGPTGVLVAHGHYGQGKSSAEAQEIAHRLAAQGHTVLAVDTPGVEEWDVPGRRIHFDAGAHNRAFLAAGGTSAMALQLAVLRRGLDLLEARGVSRIAVTGASGGAVQALYLQLIDPRVRGSVLAAPPRIPREARASGCACDQIPGWPGPDPHLLASVTGRSLWLSDVEQPRPEGLPSSVDFEVMAGPHSYTEAMQRRALDFIADVLDGGGGAFLERVPQGALSTGSADPAAAAITDLALPAPAPWTPRPAKAVAYTQSCSGAGPTVVLGGSDAADVAALHAQGFRACEVRMVTASGLDWDSVDLAESIATGQPLIDRVVGAMSAVAEREGAVAAWGARGYGLAAAGVGLPFVVRDPVRTIDAVDPLLDPPWIHVPGGWWGGVERLLALAEAAGPDRAALVESLGAKVR
jgi:dienelactone hydrolase